VQGPGGDQPTSGRKGTVIEMRFVTREVAFEVIGVVRPALEELARRDGKLADQARRAATSILLNIEEGNRRKGGDREHHFRIASGSAAELRAALLIGVVWGHIAEPTEALQLLDRLGGLLYGLTRASRQSIASSRSSNAKLASKLEPST